MLSMRWINDSVSLQFQIIRREELVKLLASLSDKMEIVARISVIARYVTLSPGMALPDVLDPLLPLTPNSPLNQSNWPTAVYDHLKYVFASSQVAVAVVMECMIHHDFDGVCVAADELLRHGTVDGLAYARPFDKPCAIMICMARFMGLLDEERWQADALDVLDALNCIMALALTPATGDTGFFEGHKLVTHSVLVFDEPTRQAIAIYFTAPHEGRTYSLDELDPDNWRIMPRSPDRLFKPSAALLDMAWSVNQFCGTIFSMVRLRRDGLAETVPCSDDLFAAITYVQKSYGKSWLPHAGLRLWADNRAAVSPLQDEIDILYGET